jgi:hypothetical protein
MRTAVPSASRPLRLSFHVPVAVLLLAACTACGSNVVKLTGSGWSAQRYVYDKAWASVSSLSTLDLLGGTAQAVLAGGYVKTDSSGQAKVTKGSGCTFYVFQNSASVFSPETISSCTKDAQASCTGDSNGAFVQEKTNCGITLATLAANITCKGTVVIVLEYSPLNAVVILVGEGSVEVAPTGMNFPAFEIPANKAAYMTIDGYIDQANAFFGFKPGDTVGFPQMVDPIQRMGRVPQVQRANLLLMGRSLPLVPLPERYQLSMRWLDETSDRFRNAAEAIAQYVPWNDLLDQNNFRGVPLFFQTGGQTINLRESPFAPGQSAGKLAEAGFDPGQEIVLGFDVSIPNLEALAAAIRQALQAEGLLKVTVEPYDPVTIADAFAPLSTRSVPVLILGGY